MDICLSQKAASWYKHLVRFMATQDEPELIITDKRFDPVSQKQRAVIYCHGTRNA